MALHSSLLPARIPNKDGSYTFHYVERTTTSDIKYVMLHEADRQYILHWFSRVLADVSERLISHANTRQIQMFINADSYFPKSSIKGTPNSALTFIAGTVSNSYRRNNVDFSKKQLKFISGLFALFADLYGKNKFFDEKDLGYHKNIPHEPPKKIKFKQSN